MIIYETQITFVIMYFNNQIFISQVEIQLDIFRAQSICKLIWQIYLIYLYKCTLHKCHFYHSLQKSKYAKIMKYYMVPNQHFISVALFFILITYFSFAFIISKFINNQGWIYMFPRVNRMMLGKHYKLQMQYNICTIAAMIKTH